MITAKVFQAFFNQFLETLPSPLKAFRAELEKPMSLWLELAIQKLNLIPREEFDIQAEQLARAKAKIEILEQRLDRIELINMNAKDR